MYIWTMNIHPEIYVSVDHELGIPTKVATRPNRTFWFTKCAMNLIAAVVTILSFLSQKSGGSFRICKSTWHWNDVYVAWWTIQQAMSCCTSWFSQSDLFISTSFNLFTFHTFPLCLLYARRNCKITRRISKSPTSGLERQKNLLNRLSFAYFA